MSRSVCYVCLEQLRPATAANTHVRGVLDALRALDWSTQLVAEAPLSSEPVSSSGRAWRYFSLQIAAAFNLRSNDVLYVRQHFASILIVTLARLLRTPVVLELNGLPGDVLASFKSLSKLSSLIYWCYTFQFRLASKVIVVTDGLADFVKRYVDADKIAVVPNGADAELFHPSRRPRPSDAPNGKYVILFGNFAVWHDDMLLIEATSQPDWPKDVSVVLIGRKSDGSDAHADGGHMIIRMNWLEQETLVDYIGHALAGIVPIASDANRAEIGAIPLKLLETLACARPAIVSRLSTQADLVLRGRCGMSFAPGDAAQLAQAVKRMAADPAEADAMGARGRALVEERYNWRTIGGEISEILDQAIATRGWRK